MGKRYRRDAKVAQASTLQKVVSETAFWALLATTAVVWMHVL